VILGNAWHAPLLLAALALCAGCDPRCLLQAVHACPEAVRKWQKYSLSALGVCFISFFGFTPFV